MDPSVVTGLFALGGVLVGGAVNVGATAAVAALQRRRDLRTSIRLVSEELDRNRQVIETALRHRTWRVIRKAPLHRDAWNEHRATLAANLPYETWAEVRHAERLISTIARVHSLEDPDRPLAPEDDIAMRDAHAQTKEVAKLVDERYSRTWHERTLPR